MGDVIMGDVIMGDVIMGDVITDSLLESARWITHPAWVSPAAEVTRVPVFRQEVVITGPVRGGELMITGVGVWRATWDGVPLGDAVLEPGSSDVRTRVALTRLDVTALLTPGTHVLEVELGEGPAHVRPVAPRYTKFVGTALSPRLRAGLRWVDASGRPTVITTDESWRTALGGTLLAHWYGGEDHDARLEPDRWVAAVPLDDRGPALWARASPPVRVVATLTAQRRSRCDDGSVLVDFGVNHAGRPVIVLGPRTPAGVRIELWPAEDLDATGHVDQTSTGKPIMDSYVTAGGSASWHPRFCYHGYRYVELRGSAGHDQLEQVDLVSEQLRSDSRRTGSFSCSDPTLSTVYTLTDRAVQSNLFTVLTDCPHREKLGWLEQLHLVFPTLAHLYDVRPQLSDMITHMTDAQTDDGLVPDIAPELTEFGGGFRDDVNWGSAIVALPFLLWQAYGDLEPARIAWPAVERYVGYLDRQLVDGLLPQGLADWKTLSPGTPATLVHGHGYLALTRAAATLAAELGHGPAPYARRADAMATRLTAEHVHADGRVDGGTQAAYALALDAGLVPAALVPAALEHLIATIDAEDHAMTVGEIALPPLFRVLAGAGRHDVLLELVTQRRHPGYGHMIDSGCTALAETWEVVQGEASANHFMLGYVVTWLTEHVAGLRRAATGWTAVVVEPHGVDLVTAATVDYDSPAGRYAVAWQADESGDVRLEVTVPPGATAEVRAPAGWQLVGTATHLASGQHLVHVRKATQADAVSGKDAPHLGS